MVINASQANNLIPFFFLVAEMRSYISVGHNSIKLVTWAALA
jgi:hypothetical protein